MSQAIGTGSISGRGNSLSRDLRITLPRALDENLLFELRLAPSSVCGGVGWGGEGHSSWSSGLMHGTNMALVRSQP